MSTGNPSAARRPLKELLKYNISALFLFAAWKLWPLLEKTQQTNNILSTLVLALAYLQEAILAGLVLGYFCLSVSDLEALSDSGDKRAARVLHLVREPSLLLATILWGESMAIAVANVGSGHMMAGRDAIVLATMLNAIAGQIIPHQVMYLYPLRVSSMFCWLVRAWKVALYIVVAPTAKALSYFERQREEDEEKMAQMRVVWSIQQILKRAKRDPSAQKTDLLRGALAVVKEDDLPVDAVSRPVDPRSMYTVQCGNTGCSSCVGQCLPQMTDADFLGLVGHLAAVKHVKWMVLVNQHGRPCGAIHAHRLRSALFAHMVSMNSPEMLQAIFAKLGPEFSVGHYVHNPPVVPRTASIASSVSRLSVRQTRRNHEVPRDLIIVDGESLGIVTAPDLFGWAFREEMTRSEAPDV